MRRAGTFALTWFGPCGIVWSPEPTRVGSAGAVTFGVMGPRSGAAPRLTQRLRPCWRGGNAKQSRYAVPDGVGAASATREPRPQTREPGGTMGLRVSVSASGHLSSAVGGELERLPDIPRSLACGVADMRTGPRLALTTPTHRNRHYRRCVAALRTGQIGAIHRW